MDKEDLIRKYNIPVPRYTSYPTVPFWDGHPPDLNHWIKTLKKTFYETNNEKGVSIYMHLPFCEKLCKYCACTRFITKNHAVEKPYIDALVKEWDIYLNLINDKPVVKELHLGGGSPTFFEAKNLQFLISNILSTIIVHKDNEFSFEAHPNSANQDHLQILYDLGFRRISFGVQDFDPVVQKTVDRVHSFMKVKELVEMARNIGYQSVNCDLIYGLPNQKLSSIDITFKYIEKLKPDRIAFYSYAHIPWKSKVQKFFNESDIPNNEEKRRLYEKGREKLIALGYHDIGMDHFALTHDNLYKANINKNLHRNFMGYNTSSTDLLFGLGISAITDAKSAYVQNSKNVMEYQKSIINGTFNYSNSYFLTEEDLVLKKSILDIACKQELEWSDHIKNYMPSGSMKALKEMQKEKIIKMQKNGFKVTDFGMTFLRNVCSLFDKKLLSKKGGKIIFSKSI